MPLRGVRFAFYGVWAVALTGLTYILGATPLKVLRTRFGRTAYWMGTTLTTAALLAAPSGSVRGLGLAFLSLVLLVGAFAELEAGGWSVRASALGTLVLNSTLAVAALGLWARAFGPGWAQAITDALETSFKPVADLNPTVHLNYASLTTQLPSVLLILWSGALYLAILLEGRLGGATDARRDLAEFRVPDAVTWAFIAGLLGAFGGLPVAGLDVVANNVLNVSLLLFFFQGIAVVAQFFQTLRVGTLPRVLFMVLVVLHLFWFVSLVGLMDYWVDFRARLKKREEKPGRGSDQKFFNDLK